VNASTNTYKRLFNLGLLQDIKKFVDFLVAVGSPISIEEHIEIILDGLYEEYDAFIASLMS